MRRPSMVLFALVVAGASLTSLPACSTRAASADVHMMPMDQLPAEMQSAPVDVRTAYQFAAANPQVSMNVPCYCGCDSLGHTSNFQCYVSRVEPGGVFVYDRHALACATCVDITLDSMRLLKEGKDIAAIRAYVDATYSKLDTSNMP